MLGARGEIIVSATHSLVVERSIITKIVNIFTKICTNNSFAANCLIK